MTRTLLISSFLCSALMIGCGDDKSQDTATTATTKTTQTSADEGGMESTGGATTDPSASSNPSSATDPSSPTTQSDATETNATTNPDTATGGGGSTGSDTDTTCGFICMEETDGTVDIQCDVFKQDCPAMGDIEQKCTAYANNGGSSWNATKCTPVTGENAVGDTCTTEGGGVSGNDTCIKGAMCWGVDPETNEGTCVGLCTGTAESPVCAEAGTVCAIANDGVLNLCLPGCDPLASDCAGDDLCIPVGDGFTCVLDASGEEGQQYDPCEYANACDQGLFCADPKNAGMCDANATGCCLQFCDTTEMPTPCTDGLKCVTWWAEGQSIPPGLENLGACIIGA